MDDGGEYEGGETKTTRQPITRNQAAMAATLDPSPMGRMQFQRKMVIREIRRRGRLSKKEALRRTERELLSKSHDFATSVKKLVPLAKQIAGKTVDDAIVQMRFSKKKVAKEVKAHLEHAKNEAIVKRGMGHGQVKGAEKNFAPVKIITKDGKRVTVEDPTTLYVDQAWCNKGFFGITPDFRARGNMHMMKNRTTSM